MRTNQPHTAETQSRLLPQLHLHPRCPEKETKRLKLQKHSHTFILNKTPSSINFIHFSFVSPDPHEFESPGWGPKPDLWLNLWRVTEVEEKKWNDDDILNNEWHTPPASSRGTRANKRKGLCSRQIISQPAESSRHVASPCWRRGVCEWVLHSISGTCTGALTCREKFCFEFLHFYSCWQFLASFIFSGCLLVSFPVLLWQLPSLCVSVCLLPAFVCFPAPVFPFCFSVPQVDSFELIWTFCGFPG